MGREVEPEVPSPRRPDELTIGHFGLALTHGHTHVAPQTGVGDRSKATYDAGSKPHAHVGGLQIVLAWSSPSVRPMAQIAPPVAERSLGVLCPGRGHTTQGHTPEREDGTPHVRSPS